MSHLQLATYAGQSSQLASLDDHHDMFYSVNLRKSEGKCNAAQETTVTAILQWCLIKLPSWCKPAMHACDSKCRSKSVHDSPGQAALPAERHSDASVLCEVRTAADEACLPEVAARSRGASLGSQAKQALRASHVAASWVGL